MDPHLDLLTLLAIAEKKAEAIGGHLTMIRSAEGWKVVLGSIPLANVENLKLQEVLRDAKTYQSLDRALFDLVCG